MTASKQATWICLVAVGASTATAPAQQPRGVQAKPGKAAKPASGTLSKKQDALHARANDLSYAGRFREAEAIYKTLEKQAPKSWKVAYNYGLLLKSLKSAGEAEKRFERAARLNPRAFEPPLAIGQIALGQGNLTRALEHLQRARALGPQYAPPIYYLGHVHLRRGDRTSAERAFRKAVELEFWPHPDIHARAAVGLGFMLEVRGQYKEAEKLYRRARDLARDIDPDLDVAKREVENIGKAVPLSVEGLLPVPGYSVFPTDLRMDTNGGLLGWEAHEFTMPPQPGPMSTPNVQLIPWRNQGGPNAPSSLFPRAKARFELKDASQPRSLWASIPVARHWKRIEIHVSMTASGLPQGAPADGAPISGVSTRWIGKDFRPMQAGPRVVAEGTRGMYRIEAGDVPTGALRLEVEMGLLAPSGWLDVHGIGIYPDPSYPLPIEAPAPSSTPATAPAPRAQQ